LFQIIVWQNYDFILSSYIKTGRSYFGYVCVHDGCNFELYIDWISRTNSSSSIKNKQLKDIKNKQLKPDLRGCVMAPFDVKSLFTNIPLKFITNLIVKSLFHDGCT